ncbi:esterase-like activity of phytase family protein [Arthrospira platensis BEA 1257B]
MSERRSLAMERSFSLDRGFVIRLFEVSVKEATDIRSLDSLRNQLEGITPVSKTPVLIPPEIQAEVIWDNLEGMTFGPTLPDGRRSLIMVSDNNFHPLLHTRIVVFAIDREYSAKPYQQRVWEWIENFFGSGVDKTGN